MTEVMAARRKKTSFLPPIKLAKTPGPSAYAPVAVDSFKKRAPRYPFGSQQRFKFQETKSLSPGPKYGLSGVTRRGTSWLPWGTRGFSFADRHVMSDEKQLWPGPGAYSPETYKSIGSRNAPAFTMAGRHHNTF